MCIRDSLQSAPRRNSYAGTVEVSIGGHVSSSRIEHTLVGGQTVDRIETQGNRPRIAYRHADEVLTLWPASRQAVREKRDPLMSFPNLLQGPASRLSQVYRVGVAGADAVAGHASKRIDLMPRDDWRFGYRLWSEARTGLPVKMQIVDARGQVLEQSASPNCACRRPWMSTPWNASAATSKAIPSRRRPCNAPRRIRKAGACRATFRVSCR